MKKIFLLSCLLLALTASPALASEYITAQGDTLDGVARLTGCDPELLAAINGLEPQAALAAGRLLTLADEPALSLTVRDGDSLASLSRAYGCSLEDLARVNGLTPPWLIFPGQQLLLPLGEEQTCFAGRGEALLVSATAPVYVARRAEDSLQWPLWGVISSPFGRRSRGWHYGLDIAAESGTAITAAASGLVTEAGWKNDAYGWTVMLDHGNGMQTLYSHCSQLLVQAGQSVGQGQSIAQVGSSGNSTGPHLHFEVRLDNECQNPADFLPDITAASI